MRRLALMLLGAVLLSAPAARAEPIEDFYRGKTLRMLIGYRPGGGYDLYARLVAEFLPRHIPGHPIIVPQNCRVLGHSRRPSLWQRPHPKDGTVFGMLAKTLALDSV